MGRNITVDKLFLNETCNNNGNKFSKSEAYDCLDAYSGLALRQNTTYIGNYSNSYYNYALFSTNVMLNGTINNIKNSHSQQNYVSYYEAILGVLAVVLVVSIALITLNRKR